MSRRTQRLIITALCMAGLVGCSTPSVITLTDGSQIQTTDVPEFDADSGFYEFEQLDGKPAKVNKDQVITVREL